MVKFNDIEKRIIASNKDLIDNSSNLKQLSDSFESRGYHISTYPIKKILLAYCLLNGIRGSIYQDDSDRQYLVFDGDTKDEVEIFDSNDPYGILADLGFNDSEIHKLVENID